MANGWHVIRFEVAAMNYQDVVAGRGKLLDDRPPYESRAA
jgi:hypothetical protein